MEPTDTPTPTPTELPYPYPTTQQIDIASDSALAIGLSDYFRVNFVFNVLVLLILGILVSMYVFKR